MKELSPNVIKSAKENKQSFRILYDYYAPYIWRIIFRTVHGRRGLAEQVLQTVFIIVHRKIGRFRFESSFSTWLYQIAWRECIHALKKEKRYRDRRAPLREELTAAEEDDSSAGEELNQLLETLTEDERFLLVSREIDGFSFEELAVITGKKNGALRTAVSRIKQKIREASYGN